MTRYGLFLAILALDIQSASAQTVGFRHGNEFRVANLQGQVMVFCPFNGPGAPMTATWGCAGESFLPVAQDKFVAQADADQVTLVATHEDGKSDSKSSRFNAKKGESGNINLGLESVFQHPLLAIGVNHIHYELTRHHRPVLAGDLDVSVVRDPDLFCPTMNLNGSSPQDCTTPNAACQDYFQRVHSCQPDSALSR